MPRHSKLSLPQAMAGLPQPPADMSAEAKAVWINTVCARPADHWHATADLAFLRIYCDLVVEVAFWNKEIAEHGELHMQPSGVMVVSPRVSIRHKRETMLLAVANRLRITPSSRYTAKDVGRLHKHATKATQHADKLDGDDLLAPAFNRSNLQ